MNFSRSLSVKNLIICTIFLCWTLSCSAKLTYYIVKFLTNSKNTILKLSFFKFLKNLEYNILIQDSDFFFDLEAFNPVAACTYERVIN